MRSMGVGHSAARKVGSRIGLASSGIAVASILLAACGSSAPPSASIDSSTIPTATAAVTTTTTTTPAVHSKVASDIIANWMVFFSGQTPAAKKLSLLENGSAFASIVNGQASSGLAQSARAKVAAISEVTATSARVHYAIYLGSSSALPSEFGVAINQDGTWKVSDASFCVLLNLEGTRTALCPIKHVGS